MTTKFKLSKNFQHESRFHLPKPKNPIVTNSDYQTVQAPGRVNIIGEHVDYAGFPVFPMAIEQCTCIKFCAVYTESAGDSNEFYINLTNTDTKYNPYKSPNILSKNSISYPKILSIFEPNKSPKWYHYFLSGLTGIINHLSKHLPESLNFESFYKTQKSITLNMVISGNIPPNAGLSSSSSCVVAASLVGYKFFILNKNLKLNNFYVENLATICAETEKLVGTAGGGMDQAISLLGQANSACLINFVPKLTTKNYNLPTNATIIVAHSGVEMNKAASNDFNERVVSTRYSAAILSNKKCWTLKEYKDCSGKSFDQILSEIENLSDEYILEELLEKYGSTVRSDCLDKNYKLKIKSRARHVISESKRVEKFINPDNSLEILGQLMNESQNSLLKNYNCSHEKLDHLCVKMLEFGAFGARLSGAGWGGCAIALVKSSNVDNFMAKMKNEFPNNLCFASSPADGAKIFE